MPKLMPRFNLNPVFKHWEKYDNIFIISDTHFGDIVTDTVNGNDYREKNTGIKTPTIDEQVVKINKICHKNDLLVILGDIGYLLPISKLKAGYKVLVMGNHDQGKSNYERINGPFVDNRLFDEVWPGICPIRPDIVLSHEPYDSKYCLNIHGHDHNCQLMKDLIKEKEIKPENYFEEQLNYCKANKFYYLNVCSEWVNYEPINLKKIIKSGILKEIPNIHREAIDKQIENPIHKSTKLIDEV